VVEGLVKEPEPRNRMREIFKSGSVGGAPGNRCFYLEAELLRRKLLKSPVIPALGGGENNE